MATIGYHASHEQFAPSELLGFVRSAERAGFRAAMCSDHFHPWSDRQGQSGFAWSWLGAAMQATGLPFGVVNAPGQRYHPAIIAQAAATLAQMFPGRFWIALGSGQALNEHITGDRWPPKPERQARLKEAVGVIRALFAGEEVDHNPEGTGGHIRVRRAKLYSRPEVPPRIIGAAVSAQTAEWVGSWADGLITVVKPPDELRRVVDAFRRGGGEGKPMLLQAQTCYAPDEAEARRAAYDQWRPNILDSAVLTELEMPEDFERESGGLTPDDLDGHIRISSDLGRHVAWLQEDIALGFEEIYVHQVGRDQGRFLDAFGERVLPALRGR
jgi:probable non-F420 flavinoid oxidoreductase